MNWYQQNCAKVIPEPGRNLLMRAVATRSLAEIDAAIIAVQKMYPNLFRKEN